MKVFACEDGGTFPSFAPPLPEDLHCVTSPPPPMSDSTPASTCTPDPSSSSSSTATARRASAATSPPRRSPSSTPSNLPRRPRRRLRVHALLVLARRLLPRRQPPLRPGHAWAMKAVHGSKTKCDKHDAEGIARLLRGDNFPLVYAYPRERRGLRDRPRREGGSEDITRSARSCPKKTGLTPVALSQGPPDPRRVAARERRRDRPTTRPGREARPNWTLPLWR